MRVASGMVVCCMHGRFWSELGCCAEDVKRCNMFRTVSNDNPESGDSGKRFSTVLQWWDVVSAPPVPAWQAICTQNVKHLLDLTGKGGIKVWRYGKRNVVNMYRLVRVQ